MYTIFIYYIFWLWTNKTFEDFLLEWDWKLSVVLHYVALIVHLNARWLVSASSFCFLSTTNIVYFRRQQQLFKKLTERTPWGLKNCAKWHALFFNWTLFLFVFGRTVTDHHQNWKVVFFPPQLHRFEALTFKYIPLFFSSVWSWHHALCSNSDRTYKIKVKDREKLRWSLITSLSPQSNCNFSDLVW